MRTTPVVIQERACCRKTSGATATPRTRAAKLVTSRSSQSVTPRPIAPTTSGGAVVIDRARTYSARAIDAPAARTGIDSVTTPTHRARLPAPPYRPRARRVPARAGCPPRRPPGTLPDTASSHQCPRPAIARERGERQLQRLFGVPLDDGEALPAQRREPRFTLQTPRGDRPARPGAMRRAIRATVRPGRRTRPPRRTRGRPDFHGLHEPGIQEGTHRENEGLGWQNAWRHHGEILGHVGENDLRRQKGVQDPLDWTRPDPGRTQRSTPPYSMSPTRSFRDK